MKVYSLWNRTWKMYYEKVMTGIIPPAISRQDNAKLLCSHVLILKMTSISSVSTQEYSWTCVNCLLHIIAIYFYHISKVSMIIALMGCQSRILKEIQCVIFQYNCRYLLSISVQKYSGHSSEMFSLQFVRQISGSMIEWQYFKCFFSNF